ncbi:MAG: Hsp20/alpha crystallin family protein [Planctomycetota bacterium]
MLARFCTTRSPLANLSRELQCFFDDATTDLGRNLSRHAGVFPALNIWDDGDVWHVEADVPGVKLDDLEIFAMGNEVTIKGQRTLADNNDQQYLRQERMTGEFQRSIKLPVEVDADKIEALLQDGVLTLHLPRAESTKPRKIQVRS